MVNGVLEVVEELIKIQEETAMVISWPKANAASEKAEATAKKAERVGDAEYEAVLNIAAADTLKCSGNPNGRRYQLRRGYLKIGYRLSARDL